MGVQHQVSPPCLSVSFFFISFLFSLSFLLLHTFSATNISFVMEYQLWTSKGSNNFFLAKSRRKFLRFSGEAKNSQGPNYKKLDFKDTINYAISTTSHTTY